VRDSSPNLPVEDAEPRRSRRLGVLALLVALAALIVGGFVLFLAGRALGSIAEYVDLLELSRTGTDIDPESLPAAARAIADAAVTQRILGFVVWGGLALWAVVQGAFAILQRRGRAWGIAAVVVAPLTFFAMQVAYTAGVALGAVPFIETVSS